MNGLVMYDRETGSLWSQVIGQAVDGSFAGKKLTILPALQTTWKRWISEHPGTLVLDKNGGHRSDSYRSYYSDSSKGILGETRNDDRLPSKALVVGVTIDGVSKAYPFAVLGRTPVVNDVVSGTPVLIAFDPESATGVVFSRYVSGAELNFIALEKSSDFRVLDMETGTLWNPLTGVALEGPLTGAVLEPVDSHYEFWFAWKDYRPETGLHMGSADGGPGVSDSGP